MEGEDIAIWEVIADCLQTSFEALAVDEKHRPDVTLFDLRDDRVVELVAARSIAAVQGSLPRIQG